MNIIPWFPVMPNKSKRRVITCPIGALKDVILKLYPNYYDSGANDKRKILLEFTDEIGEMYDFMEEVNEYGE